MGLIGQLMLVFSLLGAPEDPSAKEARILFEQATAEYETSEYVGAIVKYTKAYELSSSIQNSDLRARVQAAILFNLARAHSKRYAIDKKREHLLLAEDLLQKYLQQTADLKNEDDAKQFLEETQTELQRLEEKDAARREAEEREREKAAAAAPPPPAEPGEESKPRSRGLVIGGATMIGLGVVGAGVGVAGAVLGEQANEEYLEGPTRDDRDSAQKKGRLGNVMLVSGSVAAGVLITTGVTLTLIGRRPSSKTTAQPFFTPGGGGLVLGGQF